MILAQKAKDLNINVDSEVSKQMTAIQSDSKIADPEKFQAYIKEQSGMPFEDFKQEMKTRFLTQRVIREEVTEKMSSKHEDLEKYYNEHKSDFVREERIVLQEILISTEGKDDAGVAAAEKKAKDLVARARKGERFAEMARDNSDALTAKGLGELPAFQEGDVSSNLEDAVWNQPKGFITDPIKSANGFLILRVEDHQKAGQAELPEVENRITERLLAPRMEAAVREYLGKLRKDAFSGDQGGIHRYRRSGRQGHSLGRSGPTQTRNRKEGRGREQDLGTSDCCGAYRFREPRPPPPVRRRSKLPGFP